MNTNDLRMRLVYLDGQRNEILRILSELEKEAKVNEEKKEGGSNG